MMKTKFLLGIAVGLMLGYLAGCQAPSGGQFAIVTTQTGSPMVFLVDTQQGRTWILERTSEEIGLAWQPIVGPPFP